MTDALADFAGLPPWMATMRRAAQEAISPQDVKDIVQAQVKLAKGGNKDALKFLFDYVLGSNQFKGAQFIQNNNYGAGETPDKPTDAVPGSKEKVSKIAARVRAGMPACDPRDRADVDLS